jgi:hypothetical protein
LDGVLRAVPLSGKGDLAGMNVVLQFSGVAPEICEMPAQSRGCAMNEVRAGRSVEGVVVGVDFGTLSGRAVVVAVDDGGVLGSAVHEYPHGVIIDTTRSTPSTTGCTTTSAGVKTTHVPVAGHQTEAGMP